MEYDDAVQNLDLQQKDIITFMITIAKQQIWKRRNNIHFHDKTVSLHSLVSLINKASKHWPL